MATARLEMFSKAVSTLQALLAELMDSPSNEREHAPDAGDPQKAPPGWSPSNPSSVPTGAAGTAGGVTKQLEALAKGMSDLATAVTGIAKAQKSTHEELSKLKSGVQGSNALPVEKNRKPVSKVAWPMDLNQKPIAKGESFLNDD